MEKNWLDFNDLDPIFKVTLRLRLVENGLSTSYLLKEWIDFNHLHIYIVGILEKNWLDFGDLDPIFNLHIYIAGTWKRTD